MMRSLKDENGVQWLAQLGSYWTVGGLTRWSVRFKKANDTSENVTFGTIVLGGSNLETVSEESLLASLTEARK